MLAASQPNPESFNKSRTYASKSLDGRYLEAHDCNYFLWTKTERHMICFPRGPSIQVEGIYPKQ